MLQSMREGAKSGILKFVILGFAVFAVLGLVLMDVQGFFRSGLGGGSIAKIGFEKIAPQTFDRAAQRVLQSQGIGAQEAYRLGFLQSILHAEIGNRLINKSADKLGLKLSDEAVAAQIAELAAPMTRDGVSKSEAIKQVLRTQGISEGEFIASIRQEMTNSLVRDVLVNGTAYVSTPMLKDLYTLEKERRSVEFIVLNPKDVKDIPDANDAVLQTYYETNKEQFLVPETRTLTLVTLNRAMVESKVSISDTELEAAYQERVASFERPERRVVEQAVVDDAAQAGKIAERVKGGQTLKDAVKDITGKTQAYMGEDSYEQGGLVKDVAEPVFKAAKGDVLGPIKTSLGQHVLVMKDILAPTTDPLEKVKAGLGHDMLQVKIADEILATANAIDDRLAGGEGLESVIADFGLTTEKIGPVRATGYDAGGADKFGAYGQDRTSLLEAGFSQEEGEVAPVMELADGSFMTVRTESLTPQTYKTFDEVKDAVKQGWTEQQQGIRNFARVNDALEQIRQGKSLKDVAASLNEKVQTASSLTRDADAKPLTPMAVSVIFDTEKDAPFQAEGENGSILGIITDVTAPAAPSDKELAAIRDTLIREQGNEFTSSYLAYLFDKYRVKINEDMLHQMYGERDDG